MKNDERKYEDVLAVAYLYGSPAQLVVRKDSRIARVKELQGKKVGVGNAGSGAFANCELFFTHLDIWDKIERNAIGYNDDANAFGNRQLNAFWLFTSFPSGAVMLATQINDIDTTPLHPGAKKFWKEKGLLQRTYLSAAIGATRWVSVEVLKDRPAVSFSARSIRPRSRLAITRDPIPSQNSTTIHGEESQ